ncbi:hypothetical protein BKP35_17725 [Anaerobacillus arseniciselenatis]|uniref:VanZ-like domain-containing protein n=1 Tax=Anaerobacillus arseniciselenatis TaxID=85682 RepID=A0A1S2L7X1_9BACI|nr:VanZ family protein [Anaerobacillus arseniciselenatis]OIJ08414.1 hypothetical protein BKP35_17725 [Anaerobacillus arseniciselenatis]
MYLINLVSIGIVIIIIVLYFIIDLLKNRKKNMLKRLVFLSFLFYAINVLQQTTGGIHVPPIAEGNHWSWRWNTQLIPFYFVGDLISHYNVSGLSWFFWDAIRSSFYNVLLLFPLGVYLSLYKVGNIKRAALLIFLVSLGIETMQIISSYFGLIYARSFNVDDLILNTVGGVFGYLLFEQLNKLYSNIRYKKQRVNT